MTKFSRLAGDAYRGLVADPAQAGLLDAVDRILDRLDADPSDQSLSRHIMQTPVWERLCVVVARGPDDDWLVGWQYGDDDVPVVRYLGPGAQGVGASG